MPPASDGAAENDGAVGAVSASHADAESAWPSVAAAPPMLGELGLHLEAGERRGEGACAAAVLLDDDRRRVDRRVVVAVLDQQRDVEQVRVERARGEVGHRGVGDHVQVVADLVRAHAGAGLRGLDVDGVRAVRQVGDGRRDRR